jgi:general secretion pathway protein D
VVVANNREAYFSVGDEEPFVSSNSISPGALDGGFGSTQAHVAIRRIGTSVNLVPTLFPGEEGAVPRIRIAVRIEVGVLKGFRKLNTVDVPVVSSQKYEYTVYLKAGETLAFGGLSGMVESDSVRKLPLAGDVPVLGALFRSREKRASQRNLVAYLTASVVEEGAAAVSPPARGAGL